jgi:hypothetical protein
VTLRGFVLIVAVVMAGAGFLLGVGASLYAMGVR